MSRLPLAVAPLLVLAHAVTHAFNCGRSKRSPYAKYDWRCMARWG